MLRFVPRDARSMDEHALAALRPYAGVTARLLYARGIETAAEADAFLHPSLKQLHDPLLLHDMDKALTILRQARREQQPVVVYGDYDVDGICATSLMALALRQYGVEASPYTPLRQEGYGLNCAAVESLAARYRVMVTVDLGITNHQEVRLAQRLGMQVIVTDHHGLDLEESPADAVLNPLLGDYPFRKLCGTGVAFKVAQALLGIDKCREYLDLAALATVADIVPLVDENRVLVALGMQEMAARKRPGMRALLRVSGDPDPIDSGALGFRLGPRLNAAGRLDDAGKGVRLMMTVDAAEADALAQELDELNTRRREQEAELVKQASAAAAAHDFLSERVLIVWGEGWHVGVIGLAAGRLCQQYACPTCVLSLQDGLMHGSLRSIPGVNIHRCLQQCDDLLERYGGHEQAAGVTLKQENYPAFRKRLEQAVGEAAEESCFIPSQEYDAQVSLSELTAPLLDEISRLAPFGCQNPAPLFLSRDLRPEERRAVGADGSHLKLTLRQESVMMDAIAFGMGKLASALPDRVDAAFSLGRNTFRGVTRLQLEVKAIQPSQESWRKSLLQADEARDAGRLLTALLDVLQTANTEVSEVEPAQSASWTQLAQAFAQGSRGCLLAAQTPASAARALELGEMDFCTQVTSDPRNFATVLLSPLPSMAEGHWRQVWLLDGELCPGEADLWRSRLPQARVYALPCSDALRALAAAVDAGDERYRLLYKALRTQPRRTLGDVCLSSGLTQPQVLAGLEAFSQLRLIRYTPSPFRYSLLQAEKCTLGDSPVLRALRKLSGKP